MSESFDYELLQYNNCFLRKIRRNSVLMTFIIIWFKWLFVQLICFSLMCIWSCYQVDIFCSITSTRELIIMGAEILVNEKCLMCSIWEAKINLIKFIFISYILYSWKRKHLKTWTTQNWTQICSCFWVVHVIVGNWRVNSIYNIWNKNFRNIFMKHKHPKTWAWI